MQRHQRSLPQQFLLLAGSIFFIQQRVLDPCTSREGQSSISSGKNQSGQEPPEHPAAARDTTRVRVSCCTVGGSRQVPPPS